MIMSSDVSGIASQMERIGEQAKEATQFMRRMRPETKTAALVAAAECLAAHVPEILKANEEDLDRATAAGTTPTMLDRLLLDKRRVTAMCSGVRSVASLPDPVGRKLAQWVRPNGLQIVRVATSLGVIGVVYESRPNVTADAAAISFKSGNAAILRCGSEALCTSIAIHAAFIEGFASCNIPSNVVQLVTSTDRDAVGLMLAGLNGAIDLIIPRGGKGLMARVQADAKVPTLAHLEGICHVYVHSDAQLEKATRIALNAKMRRPGICGAAETLLLDRAILVSHGIPILEQLHASGCQIRGDQEICSSFAGALAATEDDWSTEYLAPIISVKIVTDIEEAICHIEAYGSGHTEAIITQNPTAAERFLTAVDSAIVLWNASTLFADGGEFGFGAEMGIATGKLHARGPIGPEQLTTFKYIVRGDGQIRS